MYNLWLHPVVLPQVLAGGVGITSLAHIRSLKKTVGEPEERLVPKQNAVYPGECPQLVSNGCVHQEVTQTFQNVMK